MKNLIRIMLIAAFLGSTVPQVNAMGIFKYTSTSKCQDRPTPKECAPKEKAPKEKAPKEKAPKDK